MATEQMKKIALKSMVSSVVPHCPKEILVEIVKFLNMIYPKLKDHCLNTVMPNDTVKKRELAWENINSYIQDILLPLLQAVNTEQKPLLDVVEIEPLPDNNHSGSGHTLNHAIKVYAQCRSAEKNNQI